jgi:hypothetical protein
MRSMRRTASAVAVSVCVPAAVLGGVCGCVDVHDGDSTGSAASGAVPMDAHDAAAPSPAMPTGLAYEGHVSCAALGIGTASTRIEDPGAAPAFGGARTYPLSGGHSVRVRGPGSSEAGLDWEATTPIEGFIIQGVPARSGSTQGPRSNVYLYDPPALSTLTVNPPVDDDDGHPYVVTAIELCYAQPDEEEEDGGHGGEDGGAGRDEGGGSGEAGDAGGKAF